MKHCSSQKFLKENFKVVWQVLFGLQSFIFYFSMNESILDLKNWMQGAFFNAKHYASNN